jgi:hypothetical protein
MESSSTEVVGVGVEVGVDVVVEKVVVAAAASCVGKESRFPTKLPGSIVKSRETDGHGMEGREMLSRSVVVDDGVEAFDMEAYAGPHWIGTSPGNPLASMWTFS